MSFCCLKYPRSATGLPNDITARYAHISLEKGFGVGTRVRRGQVFSRIASSAKYPPSSGVVHIEFWVERRVVNPLRIFVGDLKIKDGKIEIPYLSKRHGPIPDGAKILWPIPCLSSPQVQGHF